MNRITITLEGPDAEQALNEMVSAAQYDNLTVTILNHGTDADTGPSVLCYDGQQTYGTDAEVDKLIAELQKGDA